TTTRPIPPRSPPNIRPDPAMVVSYTTSADVTALTDVERAEATLVALLLAGDLPAAQYQRDMAALAVRDALRNPMVVPPERGL
ncbi:hypothetical protein AB0I37_16515, partial [Micromonospora purpureochromogenes]|uniref:hypothetical protein n=1 Tax=Micromonospora purpureochromogenes TaxID=47872 RepID=UPI0033C08213